MKNLLKLLCFTLILTSCQQQASQEESNSEPASSSYDANATLSEMSESAVIYEANIRQYSPEGTFNAFTKDIPVLKDLGVKIIWVMPIHPISKVKRKATDGSFTSDIEDEIERAKYLGSYYSVSDYKAINPEFGTLEDFKQLVNAAHDNNIHVIIDWVPNHTGWDHPWIYDHPEWYTQNEAGEIIDPIDPGTGESWGWTDVADLNYDNMEMHAEMIADMKYWLEEADIDGFRVDVAHNVPPEFFTVAIEELRKVKPQFMLAEAEIDELYDAGFDMQYAWEGHHLLNRIAHGESDAGDFFSYIDRQRDFKMNFVTNHDENSWAGSLSERMPENKELFTALTYTMPGMPLIYSGQEYDMSHRLKFFEKDSIPKTKGSYFDLLVKLGELKNTSAALNGGPDAAAFERISSNNDLIAFTRMKGNEAITFIGNVSDSEQTMSGMDPGVYADYIEDVDLEINEGDEIVLGPWEFKILIH